MNVVTAVELDIESNDTVVEKLRIMYASAQKELNQFKATLAANPLYAFEWSAAAVQAAAIVDVVNGFAARLDRHEFLANPIQRQLNLEAVLRWLHAELLRCATGGGPGRHNVNTAYVAALATVYEKMSTQEMVAK
jgi:hypothetical protein